MAVLPLSGGGNPQGASAVGPFKGSGAASAVVIPPSREQEVVCKFCLKALQHFWIAVEQCARLYTVQVDGVCSLGGGAQLFVELATGQLWGQGHDCVWYLISIAFKNIRWSLENPGRN